MKNKLKNIVKDCISVFGRIHKVQRKNIPDKVRKALVLVPSWEGSLGDEAVLDSIGRELRKNNITPHLLHYGDSPEWRGLESYEKRVNIKGFFSGAHWKTRLELARILPEYDLFYLMGTDMLDGCYAEWLTLGLLDITRQASITGLKTSIVGFSINKWQKASCIKALKNMPKQVRQCVRDDVSRRRLIELTGRNDLLLTADMAFLLIPEQNSLVSNRYINWISEQHSCGDLVVGLNINPQLFDDFSETERESVPRKFADAIEKTSISFEGKCCFLLIPHDYRDNNSDITLLNAVMDEISPSLSSKILMIDSRPKAAEIKGIIKELDVIITGRMHVAIASLGNGNPLGCFVYQGKFEGLFRHFNLDHNGIVDPVILKDSDQTADFLTKVIRNRSLIKKQVEANLPKVKALAFNNLGL